MAGIRDFKKTLVINDQEDDNKIYPPYVGFSKVVW